MARNVIAKFQHDINLYIEGEKCHGEDGLRKPCDFVPRKAILDFDWTGSKIIDAIRLESPVASIPDVEEIREKYLTVFSILVSLSRPQDIGLFMQFQVLDNTLPLTAIPTDWPRASSPSDEYSIIHLQSFMESQWKFCPFILDRHHQVRLPERQILPITRSGDPLCDKDTVSLHKVKIHRDCRAKSLPVSTEHTWHPLHTRR